MEALRNDRQTATTYANRIGQFRRLMWSVETIHLFPCVKEETS